MGDADRAARAAFLGGARGRRRARAGICPADHRARARALGGRRRDRRGALRRRRPGGAGRRRDRAPRRALPRDGAPARRVGGARAQLPDVGLARAADAADGDPRARRRAARGRRRPTRSWPMRRSRSSRTRPSGWPARRRRARPREARRPPVHRAHARRSTWAGCATAPIRPSPRRPGGVGSSTAAGGRGAGDRHRRRPRPPDHLEPPLERLPLDARRRPDRRSRSAARTGL